MESNPNMGFILPVQRLWHHKKPLVIRSYRNEYKSTQSWVECLHVFGDRAPAVKAAIHFKMPEILVGNIKGH